MFFPPPLSSPSPSYEENHECQLDSTEPWAVVYRTPTRFVPHTRAHTAPLEVKQIDFSLSPPNNTKALRVQVALKRARRGQAPRG